MEDKVLKEGFYTALGTPVDNNGNLIADSFQKHVEEQIEAGASGLLAMGSMGIEPYLKQSEYRKIALAASETARGRCPVLVGVMDNSIARVMEMIDSLEGLHIDGVVATTPFYYSVTQEELKKFFSEIADRSKYPLYLYDLAVVTKTKIAVGTIEFLMQHDNIKGIKTGDLIAVRELSRNCRWKDDFAVIYSGLDTFDAAWQYGVKMNLDGMFSCTPVTTSKLYKSLEQNDFEQAGKYLDEILTLRNTLVEVGVFKGFTCAMNILGYEGSFAPDYTGEPEEKDFDKIRQCMKKCGMT